MVTRILGLYASRRHCIKRNEGSAEDLNLMTLAKGCSDEDKARLCLNRGAETRKTATINYLSMFIKLIVDFFWGSDYQFDRY
jgi:hypothetical protein